MCYRSVQGDRTQGMSDARREFRVSFVFVSGELGHDI